MNPEQILQEAVKFGLKLGVDEVAATVARERQKMLRFSNNSIIVMQSWDHTVPAVYLTSKRRRAAARVGDPNLSALKDVMETLKSTMDISKPGDVETRLPKGPFRYETIPDTYDDRIPKMTNELTDVAEEAIVAALAEGAKRTSGTLITNEWERFVKTSAGAEGQDRGTNIELSIRAFVEDDASGMGVSCGTRLQDFDARHAAKEAAEIACKAKNPVFGDEGKFAVVFGPSVMADFLERVASSASAYNVDIGLSCLGDRIGQKIASEKLTLLDDSRMPGGMNSCSFDDEGYPTRSTRVIDKGVLKTYLHSSYSVAKYGGELTGNAFFAGGTWGITPVPLNVVVEPGEHSLEELLQEIGNGLYLTNNWYTRFQNYQTGDFSSICRDGAFRIKNGKIDQPLKGLRISDNMPRIMQAITALSKERQWIKWWEVTTPAYLPHIAVEGVGITKATK